MNGSKKLQQLLAVICIFTILLCSCRKAENTLSTKQAEETQISHKTLRLMIGTLCSVIGTLLALYVGGWLMLCKPIQGVVSAYFAGNLTIGIIALAVFKCLLSVTVAGAIWCGGYIAKCKFIGHEDY